GATDSRRTGLSVEGAGLPFVFSRPTRSRCSCQRAVRRLRLLLIGVRQLARACAKVLRDGQGTLRTDIGQPCRGTRKQRWLSAEKLRGGRNPGSRNRSVTYCRGRR